MSKRNQPEPADEYVDLTPDGEEPELVDIEAEASAEELLDRLDLSSGGGEEVGEAADADMATAASDPGLHQRCADLEAKLLRTAADYQNYVRRATREIEATRSQRVVDVARALVTALDHFDRALQIDPEQSSAEEVLAGVGSIRSEVLKALGAFGLQRVDVEPGEEFDPNRHEALMHLPHDDIAPGHVIETLMPGYFVSDTPVRPAQVSVAQ